MLRALLRLPPVYRLAAFIAARRVLVRGWSMYPTLAPGERVLFDTLAYRLERPQRGDVVLATHPGDPTTKLVKRVTAVPSDRVTVRGDDWRVEGAPDRTGSASEGSDAAEARTWTLGPGAATSEVGAGWSTGRRLACARSGDGRLGRTRRATSNT